MPKVIDPKAVFQDGWDPTAAAPIGPGGEVLPSPKMRPVIEPPTLCDQGPCRHYHQLVTLANAQGPKDGSLVAYKQTVKTCYPEPGIEMPLNDVPVFACNRWDPGVPIATHQKTLAWSRYIDALVAWDALVAQSRGPTTEPGTIPTAPATDADLAGLGLASPAPGDPIP